MRESFIFYKSFLECLKELPDEERLMLYDTIARYGIDGETIETNGLTKAIFALIKPLIDANTVRYENGKKGGRPKTERKPKQNQKETEAEPNVNVNVNVNENVNDNANVNVLSVTHRFVPPTVDEVNAYIKAKGYTVDAQRFVNFYESKGWVVGKAKMKDWKAAVRNWASSSRKEQIRPGYLSKEITDVEATIEQLTEVNEMMRRFE